MPSATGGALALAVVCHALVFTAAKPSDFRTCAECIEGGFGWSLKKGKCGGFANKDCPAEAATPPTPPVNIAPRPSIAAPYAKLPPASVQEIDEAAVRMEAERKAIDEQNMEDAYEYATSNPANKPWSGGGSVMCAKAKENGDVELRCAGFDTIAKVLFASYGSPVGYCRTDETSGTFEIKPECHAPSSQEQVEAACLGEQYCAVSASNRAFGDPCYGSGKSLAVTVECTTDKNEPKLPPGRSESPPQLPPLPRVTMAQLQLRPDLLVGDKPFAVLDAVWEWPSIENGTNEWSVDYFLEKFGEDEISDYFFNGKGNKEEVGRKVPFGHAVPDFHEAKGTERTPYFLWYVPLKLWRTFETDAAPMHDWLWNQEGALSECLGEDGLASVFAMTNWRMILIGQRHTMFSLHTDNVDSATWQAQLKGRKRWRVCPPSETPFLYETRSGSSDLNTFHVDPDRFPLWKYARCYDYVAKPGELLYYPPNYWHGTMNLDDESISLTSRVMHPSNYKLVFAKFREDCGKPAFKVPEGYEAPPRLSDHVCANLNKCEKFIGDRVQGMMQYDSLAPRTSGLNVDIIRRNGGAKKSKRKRRAEL